MMYRPNTINKKCANVTKDPGNWKKGKSMNTLFFYGSQNHVNSHTPIRIQWAKQMGISYLASPVKKSVHKAELFMTSKISSEDQGGL